MPKIIQNLNIDITCRSCLAECDTLTSLYSVAETFHSPLSLGDILLKLFQVKWNESVELPTKICDSCQQELITAYNFKIKTEESENALVDYLRRNELFNSADAIEKSDYNLMKIKDEKHEDTNFDDIFSSEPINVDSNLCISKNFYDEKGGQNKNSVREEEFEQQNDEYFLIKKVTENLICNQCNIEFAVKLEFDEHIKTHENEKESARFYCEVCNKNFVSNKNLERHSKKHLKKKSDVKVLEVPEFVPSKLKMAIDRHYGCTSCSAKFSSPVQLKCHMKAHTGKSFYCELCDRFFVNNRNLQRHLKLHSEEKEEFKCSNCEKNFETKLKLKLHERTHNTFGVDIDGIDLDKNNCMPHETKYLECKICDLKFDKIFLLRRHLIGHSEIETIDPNFVEKSYYLKSLIPDSREDIQRIINFISEEVRNGHFHKFYSGTNLIGNELNFSDSETDVDETNSETVTLSRLYTCENCFEIFDRRYKILRHQRYVHSLEEHKYECDLCHMRYVSEDLLEYHKKSQCYNDEKSYTCDVCQMKFMWKANIEEHIRIHHSRTRAPQKLIRKYSSKCKLDCEICYKKFSRPEHLERHLRTHNPAEKKFECPKCKKKFSRKDNLRCHMKVHDEKRTDIGDEGKHFLCVFCGRKFRNSSNLVVHTRRHTGEKPFKCDFCDKGFPRSSDLRTHRRTHTGEKPHLCNTCGKGFSRSNKLTRHMRIHTGDRPYKCTYCDRAFTQSNDLTIHIRRHTGEKPYTCGICGERFIQGTALQTHRKTRGHYEDVAGVDVPFAHLSQNNPNPLNNAGRVDQIGLPKPNSLKNNEDTKPMKNELPDDENVTMESHLGKVKNSINKVNSLPQHIVDRNPDSDVGIGNSSFNYKDISSFVTGAQAHHPYIQCNPLTLPLLQSTSVISNTPHNGGSLCATNYTILESETSSYNNDSKIKTEESEKDLFDYLRRLNSAEAVENSDCNSIEINDFQHENTDFDEIFNSEPVNIDSDSDIDKNFNSEQDGQKKDSIREDEFVEENYDNVLLVSKKVSESLICNQCNLEFTTKSGFDEHVKIHEKKSSKFICKVCNKNFALIKNFEQHLKNHLENKFNVKPIAVPEPLPSKPQTLFEGQGNDKKKIDVETIEVPKSLPSKRNTTFERLFGCTKCSAKLSTPTQLQFHMKAHSGKRFYCELCERFFVNNRNLQRHLYNLHSIGKEEFESPSSKKLSKPEIKLKLQEKSQNNLIVDIDGIDKISCRPQEVIYVDEHGESTRENEIEQENNDNFPLVSKKVTENLTCNQCNLESANKLEFDKHIKTHEIEKKSAKFYCEVCNKCFVSNKNLERHSKTHLEKKGDVDTVGVTESLTLKPKNSFKRQQKNKKKSEVKVIADSGFLSIKPKTTFERQGNIDGINLDKNSCGPNETIYLDEQDGQRKESIREDEVKEKHNENFSLVSKKVTENLTGTQCNLELPIKLELDEHVETDGKESSKSYCEVLNKNLEKIDVEPLNQQVEFKRQENCKEKSGVKVIEVPESPPSKPKTTHERQEKDKTKSDVKVITRPFLYDCAKCSAKLPNLDQLKFHMKAHSGKNFYCESCDRFFVNNRNLQRHLLLHSEEKVKCGTTSKNLDQHRKSHLEKKTVVQAITVAEPLTLKPNSNYKTHYSCINCSAKFSTLIQLKCHKRAHSEKKFYCEWCDQYFVSNRNLQNHFRSHSEFKCSNCEKKFQTKKKLKLHERTHNTFGVDIDGIDLDKNNCMPHETKYLECKICDLKFDKIFLLRRHLIGHGEIETIDPDFVEKSNHLKSLIPDNREDIQKIINFISEEVRNGHFHKFYSGTNLIGNELNISDSETDVDETNSETVTLSRLYTCQNCSETFDRRYKILRHQRYVHPLKEHKYECDLCHMRYVSEDLLEYHKKSQCYNDEKSYTCDVCQMKFMWKANIEKHIAIHHSSTAASTKPDLLKRHLKTNIQREKKFECPKCKKKFTTKTGLRLHMDLHDEKRSEEGKHFLCVFCGRKFRNSSALVVHTRRHTGEKPFKCDLCDKAFPRSSCLHEHRRTHTGEKPHKCGICGKGCSRAYKLRRHMRTHTGERPFKCTYCDRAFAQDNDLKIHIRRHTGEKPYACGICGDRFIQKTLLETHRKTRGHYENVPGVDAPFAHLSKNNPNPFNNINRVDHIGIPNFKIKTEESEKALFDYLRRLNSAEAVENSGCNSIEIKDFQHENTDFDEIFNSEPVNIDSDSDVDKNFNSEQDGQKKDSIREDEFVEENYDNVLLVSKKVSESLICNQCNLEFTTKSGFDEHVKIHEKKSSKFNCKVCNKNFALIKNFEQHLKNHLENKGNVKPIAVPEPLPSKPQTLFEGQGNDKKKIDVETIEVPKSLPSKRNTTFERLFGCTKCSAKLSTPTQLQFHMKAHSGKRFYCELCERFFVNNRNLQRHLYNLHSIGKEEFESPSSKKLSKPEIKLKLQEKSQNNLIVDIDGIDKISCRPQEVIYVDEHGESTRENEIEQENNDNFPLVSKKVTENLTCNQCNLESANKLEFDKHIKTHEIEKKSAKLYCEVCNKCFVSNKNLERHSKTHLEKKGDVDTVGVTESLTLKPKNSFKRQQKNKKKSEVKVIADSGFLSIKPKTTFERQGNIDGINLDKNSCGPNETIYLDEQDGQRKESIRGDEVKEKHNENFSLVSKKVTENLTGTQCNLELPIKLELDEHVETDGKESSKSYCEVLNKNLEKIDVEPLNQQVEFKRQENCKEKSGVKVIEVPESPPSKPKTTHERQEKDKRKSDVKVITRPFLYDCAKCSAKLPNLDQLKFHMKAHSGKNFYCESCDRFFVNNRNLQRHLLLHSEEKVKCGTTSKNLEQHRKSHLEKKTVVQAITVAEPLPLKPNSNYKTHYSCINCSAKFSTLIQLKCHKRAHSEKKFYCEWCDQYFVSNRNLQNHFRSHSEFKCSNCGKKFQTRKKLKLHERTHNTFGVDIDGIDLDKNNCMPHETKYLECKICDLKFDKIFLLRRHLIGHGEIETIDPDFVEKSNHLKSLIPDNREDIQKIINFISEEVRKGHFHKFYSGTNLIGNELNISDSETDVDETNSETVTLSRLYTCQNCSETFDRRYKILRHQRYVHPLKEHKYECDLCHMRYVSEDLLEYHKKSQCYNDEKSYTCDVCQMKFMWKANIEKHITIHHSSTAASTKPDLLKRHLKTNIQREKKFECPKCKKKFTTKTGLRLHMDLHDEKRLEEGKHFLCVFCGRKFRNSSTLVVHTRRHTGEKPFKCDLCDKAFPRSSCLHEHRRTHTGEKPHKCGICGKGCSRAYQLRRHMRTHTGERPFKCTYCDRAFAQSNDLTIHIRRHTGEKPYTCGICGDRFIQKTLLETHRKTRGHYENVPGVDAPFAHLSKNNPNPFNNIKRVDHIGKPA
ncbi:uncharacterized protein LOC129605651 [Condylostylus longicornis]|uniref:uncharacterized protein LOC129605651 n=1 Tax=Condylostylus longicornis TaxID=2530218 RepID=UPI00244DFBFB|nr:uncharacterized protein LOC129605651 [Condylostylus longicornis]